MLDRVLRCNDAGWEVEADPRHGELIAEQLGIAQSKGLSAPGNDDDESVESGDDELSVGADTSLVRGLATRCNDMAVDKPDLPYAPKEVCREMAKPMKCQLKKLTRLARYMVAAPRLIWMFQYQGWTQTLLVHVDSNWAGCRRTRNSTPGGASNR